MTLRYGVIALARTTFDMEFAEEMKNKAFAALDAAGIATAGPRTLACDTTQAEAALGRAEVERIASSDHDHTITDSDRELLGGSLTQDALPLGGDSLRTVFQ